jgi:hypothetical protein
MIDHILLDLIASMRQAFEGALLEQQAVEERFQVDVFLGDISFETSYSLPGEESPARIKADVTLDWPTWSQSAYRSWSIGEPPAEPPDLIIELTFRLQRLATVPDARAIAESLEPFSPALGAEQLVRSAPTVEQTFDHDGGTVTALEVTYDGSVSLDDTVLETPAKLDDQIAALARFVASTLVRLADLELPFLPPESDSEHA